MGIDDFSFMEMIPDNVGDLIPDFGGDDDGPALTDKISTKLGNAISVLKDTGSKIAASISKAREKLSSNAEAMASHMQRNPPPKLPDTQEGVSSHSGPHEAPLKSPELSSERLGDISQSVQSEDYINTFTHIKHSPEAVQEASERMTDVGRRILKGSSQVELSGDQLQRLERLDQLKSSMSAKIEKLPISTAKQGVDFRSMNATMMQVLAHHTMLSKRPEGDLKDSEREELRQCKEVLNEYSEVIAHAEEIFDVQMVGFGGDAHIDNMQFGMGQLELLEGQLESEGKSVSQLVTEHVVAGRDTDTPVTGLDLKRASKARTLVTEMQAKFGLPVGTSPSNSIDGFSGRMAEVRNQMAELRNPDTEHPDIKDLSPEEKAAKRKDLQQELVSLKKQRTEYKGQLAELGINIDKPERANKLFQALETFESSHGSIDILGKFQVTTEHQNQLDNVLEDKGKLEKLTDKKLSFSEYTEFVNKGETEGSNPKHDAMLAKLETKLGKDGAAEFLGKAKSNLNAFQSGASESLKERFGLQGSGASSDQILGKEIDKYHEVSVSLKSSGFKPADSNDNVLQIASHSWDVVEKVIGEKGLESVISGNAYTELDKEQENYNSFLETGSRAEWREQNLPDSTVDAAPADAKGSEVSASISTSKKEKAEAARTESSSSKDAKEKHGEGAWKASSASERGAGLSSVKEHYEAPNAGKGEQTHKSSPVATPQGGVTKEAHLSDKAGIEEHKRAPELRKSTPLRERSRVSESPGEEKKSPSTEVGEGAHAERPASSRADVREYNVGTSRGEQVSVKEMAQEARETFSVKPSGEASFDAHIPTSEIKHTFVQEKREQFEVEVQKASDNIREALGSFRSAVDVDMVQYKKLSDELVTATSIEDQKRIEGELAKASDEIVSKLETGARAIVEVGQGISAVREDAEEAIQSQLNEVSSRKEELEAVVSKREDLTDKPLEEHLETSILTQRKEIAVLKQKHEELLDFQDEQLERQAIMAQELQNAMEEAYAVQTALAKEVDPDKIEEAAIRAGERGAATLAKSREVASQAGQGQSQIGQSPIPQAVAGADGKEGSQDDGQHEQQGQGGSNSEEEEEEVLQ